jgi:hypothetical protein
LQTQPEHFKALGEYNGTDILPLFSIGSCKDEIGSANYEK